MNRAALTRRLDEAEKTARTARKVQYLAGLRELDLLNHADLCRLGVFEPAGEELDRRADAFRWEAAREETDAAWLASLPAEERESVLALRHARDLIHPHLTDEIMRTLRYSWVWDYFHRARADFELPGGAARLVEATARDTALVVTTDTAADLLTITYAQREAELFALVERENPGALALPAPIQAGRGLV